MPVKKLDEDLIPQKSAASRSVANAFTSELRRCSVTFGGEKEWSG